MTSEPSLLGRIEAYFGAHRVPQRAEHERDRSLQRGVVAARRYDAVLLDIQMPVKSGAEIAAETRAGNGPNRETRLLGMSAAEVTAQYTDGPFDACLTKPIDRNALVSALRDEWPETWPSSTI